MVEKSITGIVTWLKNWFYDKDEVTSYLNGKVNVSQGSGASNQALITDSGGNVTLGAKNDHSHGSLTSDGKVGSTSGKIITTGTDGAIQASDSITKSMISDFPSTMTPSSHTHGQVTNDGKITSTAVTVASEDNIVITDASDSSKVKRVANLLASHIKDSTAHSNIGSSANDSQDTINTKIDTALGGKASSSHNHSIILDEYDDGDLLIYPNVNSQSIPQGNPIHLGAYLKLLSEDIESIANIDFLNIIPSSEWDSTYEDNPSSSTMNKLFIVVGSTTTDIYYTKATTTNDTTTYSWQSFDTDILDGLSINWSDITGKPSTFTPSSHSHGNLDNTGKVLINNTLYGNWVLITDANGYLSATEQLGAQYVKDTRAYTNIGSSANASQYTINGKIDTALASKGALTDDIDWSYTDATSGFVNGIKLHPKTSTGDDATGTISFKLKSSS